MTGPTASDAQIQTARLQPQAVPSVCTCGLSQLIDFQCVCETEMSFWELKFLSILEASALVVNNRLSSPIKCMSRPFIVLQLQLNICQWSDIILSPHSAFTLQPGQSVIFLYLSYKCVF